MNGGTIQKTSSTLIRVSAMLAGLEKRFARTQPIAPRRRGRRRHRLDRRRRAHRRSRRSGSLHAVLRCDRHGAHRSTSAMRALYQFITIEVTRLIVR